MDENIDDREIYRRALVEIWGILQPNAVGKVEDGAAEKALTRAIDSLNFVQSREYALTFKSAVERGLSDANSGRVISDDELVKRVTSRIELEKNKSTSKRRQD